MFLPISKSGLLACTILAALTACADPTGEPEGANIDCAIGPGSEFSNVCVAERVSADAFVIHHPDGGFRRFTLSEDGEQSIAVADGAEPVTYERTDPQTGVLEFGLTVDRYRLNLDFLAAASDE